MVRMTSVNPEFSPRDGPGDRVARWQECMPLFSLLLYSLKSYSTSYFVSSVQGF